MKNLKLGILLGTLCAAAVSLPLNVSAQQQNVKSTHGSWQVKCNGPRNKTVNAADLVKELAESVAEKPEVAEPPKPKVGEQCGMVQVVASKKRKNVVLTVIIFKQKAPKGKTANPMLRVVAPAGVFLPNGLAMEVDGDAKGRINYSRCLPQGCFATAPLTKELLGALKSGAEANFIIYEAPGRGLALGVSLKGFTAAFKAL